MVLSHCILIAIFIHLIQQVLAIVVEGQEDVIEYNSQKQFEVFNAVNRWNEQFINDYQYLDREDIAMISSTQNIYFFSFKEAKVLSTYKVPSNSFLKEVKCSFEAQYTNCYLLNNLGYLYKYPFLQTFQFDAVQPSLLNMSNLKVEAFTEIKTIIINSQESSTYYSIVLNSVQNQRFVFYTVVKSEGDKINNTNIYTIQNILCNVSTLQEFESQQYIVADECGNLLYINLISIKESMVRRYETLFTVIKMFYAINQKYLISIMLNSQNNMRRLAFYNVEKGLEELTPVQSMEGYDFKVIAQNQFDLQIVQVLPNEGSKIIKIGSNQEFESVIEINNQISYLYFLPKNNVTIHIDSNYNRYKKQNNTMLVYPLFFLDLNIVKQQVNVVYQKCQEIDDQQEYAMYFTYSNNCSFSYCSKDKILSNNSNICKSTSANYENSYIQVLYTSEVGQLMYNLDKLILQIILGSSVAVVLIVAFTVSKCVQWIELDILVIRKKYSDLYNQDTETNLNMNINSYQENESIYDFKSPKSEVENEKLKKIPNLKSLYNQLINNYQNVQNLQPNQKKIINNDSDEDQEDDLKNTINVQDQQFTQNYTEFFINPTLPNYTQEYNQNDNISYIERKNQNTNFEKQRQNQQFALLDDQSSVYQINDDGQTYLRDQPTINFDQNTLNFDNISLNRVPNFNHLRKDRPTSTILHRNKDQHLNVQQVVEDIERKRKYEKTIRQEEQVKQEYQQKLVSDEKHLTPKRLKRKKPLNNNEELDIQSLEAGDDALSYRREERIQNNKILWDQQGYQLPNQRTEDIYQRKRDSDIIKKNKNDQDIRSRYPSPLILNYVKSQKQKEIEPSKEQQKDVLQFTDYRGNNELRKSHSMQLPIQNQFANLEQMQQKETIKKKIEDKLLQMKEKRRLKKGNLQQKQQGEPE